jgi:hypothetical protein
MTVETCTVRCDRCGKSETFLDAAKTGVSYAQCAAQIQMPNNQPRQVMFHLCPECAVSDHLFLEPDRIAVATGADLHKLNGGKGG